MMFFPLLTALQSTLVPPRQSRSGESSDDGRSSKHSSEGGGPAKGGEKTRGLIPGDSTSGTAIPTESTQTTPQTLRDGILNTDAALPTTAAGRHALKRWQERLAQEKSGAGGGTGSNF